MKLLNKTWLFAACIIMTCQTAWSQNDLKSLSRTEALAIPVIWTDAQGTTHNDNLATTATDPRHIMALLKEVYTNPNIPGPYYSAYKADGVTREDEVYYGPIGVSNPANNGWGITGLVTKPYEEGYTVMMVAVKDDYSTLSTDFTDKTADQIRSFISNYIDSVFVITDGLRLSSGTNPGTMFTVRGKFNRFFFLSKGKARVNTNGKSAVPFYRMFEEFSPYKEGDTNNDVTDFYNLMIRGESMPIEHDCSTVFGLNHYFSMSGRTGTTAYDMTGLNIFIPDHRLQYWEDNRLFYNQNKTQSRRIKVDGRSTFYQTLSATEFSNSNYVPSPNATFTNYNQNYPVISFLYAIHLNASLSDQPNAQNQYTVTLDWSSTFAEATGSDLPQYYWLYRVVNGKMESEPIANFTDVLTWSEQVDQLEQGYMLSYVVTGKPITASYEPIPSNVASIAIPGSDPEERLALSISGKHESEYDPTDQINKYANYVVLNNAVGNNITRAMLKQNQTKIILHRVDQGSEQALKDVATLSFGTISNNGCNWTLAYNYQDHADQSKYGPLSGTFAINSDGAVNFNNALLCDQFSASTMLNDQQVDYTYYVTIEDLVDGAFLDLEGNPCNHAHSNSTNVYVYTTEYSLSTKTFTQAEVESDITSDNLLTLQPGVSMTVKTLNDRNVLNYNMYRNKANSGAYAQNTNDGSYTVHNNDATLSTQSYFVPSATIIDLPQASGPFDYVPVIEVYRDDNSGNRNTYGADIKQASIAHVTASGIGIDKSEDIFEGVNAQGETAENCRYYHVKLEVTPDLPDNVSPQFIRVWHQLPEGRAYEITYDDGHGYAFRLDQTQRCYLYEEAYGGLYSGQVPLQDFYTGNNRNTIEAHDYFGALDNGQDFSVDYIVRYYSKRGTGAAGAPGQRKAGSDDDWFIAEKRMTVNVSSGIITSVAGVKHQPLVRKVRYSDLQGRMSDAPWPGVNVVVTTWDDGRITTSKRVY